MCEVGKSKWSSHPKYNGLIDELKIFNKALTVEEINHNMNL